MNSLWIKVTGCQFEERLEQSADDYQVADVRSFAPSTLGQSRAANGFSQFQHQTWLALSATRLNLPGARIADAFGPQHGWTTYSDRFATEATDRTLPAGELNIRA